MAYINLRDSEIFIYSFDGLEHENKLKKRSFASTHKFLQLSFSFPKKVLYLTQRKAHNGAKSGKGLIKSSSCATMTIAKVKLPHNAFKTRLKPLDRL